ncbi:MAG: NUDIX hydrolase [Clostridiales bacterium]|nr:NUDIX hydrolase [Clostridiales bacterium]
MELWDAYDKDFNRIDGVTLFRGEPIPDGCLHLVCDFMVKHTDGTYLVMRRDLRKHLGGKWEMSGGGSALQGEDPETAAIREMREETGIIAGNITEIGRLLIAEHHAWTVQFLAVTDCPKDAVVLQEGETIGHQWVDREKLLAMEASGELVSCRVMAILHRMGL